MKAWKACERKVAALLGGRRIPVSGRGCGDNPDIHHELFSIEVKSRKKPPAWRDNAMRQAEVSVKGKRLPVVVLHQDWAPYAESLVVLRLEDFAGYLKGES